MNKIILTGHSSRDVELETSASGKTFARINLAVARKYDKDTTDWFNCVVFGALAEKVASVYVKKGSKVAITGRLEFNEQEKDNGEKVKHHSVVVEDIELLGSKNNNETTTNTTNQAELKPIDADDLPF